MYLYVEEYELMRRGTLGDLKHRFGNSGYSTGSLKVYRNLSHGGYIAIVSRQVIPDGVAYLSLAHRSKVPLWKQSMQLQMGRLPEKETVNYSNIVVEDTTEEVWQRNSLQLTVFEYR